MIKNKCNLSPTIKKKIIFSAMSDVSWARKMKMMMASRGKIDPSLLRLQPLESLTRARDKSRR